MLRSPRVRVVAPVALLALTLGMPSAALAETAPAPSPTISESAPASPTTSPSSTATPTPSGTDSPSTEPTVPASPEPSTATPEATSDATTPAPSTAAKGKAQPFVGRVSKARLKGSASEHAGYAGGYMVRTLAAQGHHYVYPGGDFFDGGNTIDALLGLAGAKVGGTEAAQVLDQLEKNVGTYVGSDGETYAGPLGKLIIGVDAAGADATDFGGQDLVERLQGLVTESGRISDASEWGDYSNTIGQSLDLIALGRTTGEAPDIAVDFLIDQQCADGGLRGSLAPAGGECKSDLDATAFAAQTLIGFGADEEAEKALDYLASKQQSNGGFINGDGVVNTNSTAVAAQAFSTAGWTQELTKAQGYLSNLQLDCSFDAAIRGGIAFSAADRETLLKSPKDQDAIDKMLRATPQSTLGLAGGSLLDVSAEGSAATAPSATCPSSPSPTGSTTKPPATSTPTGTGGAPGTTPPSAGGQNGPGLAYTGASPVTPLLVAVFLLLAGGATVLVARRRGVHQ